MTAISVSIQEFDRDACRARNAAQDGPVFITDQGKPAHVLMTMDEYRRLTGWATSLAAALAQEGDEEVEFIPPRVGTGLFGPADLD